MLALEHRGVRARIGLRVGAGEIARRRGGERLSFEGHALAAEIALQQEPEVIAAAEAGGADAPRLKDESGGGVGRLPRRRLGQRVDPFPEVLGTGLGGLPHRGHGGDVGHRVVAECDSRGAVRARAVAGPEMLGDVLRVEPEVAGADGQDGAGRESDEVVGKRHRAGLVVVVHAERLPGRGEPGAEVLDVQVADAEGDGRGVVGGIRAEAVEPHGVAAAQEREGRGGHACVLLAPRRRVGGNGAIAPLLVGADQLRGVHRAIV